MQNFNAGELAGSVQTANPTINIYNSGESKGSNITLEELNQKQKKIDILREQKTELNLLYQECQQQLENLTQNESLNR